MNRREFSSACVLVLMLFALPAAAQQLQDKPRQPDDRPVERRKQRLAEPAEIQRDVTRLLKQFDQNADGLLAPDEIPAALQRKFAALDANEDGNFSESELLKMRVRSGRRAGEVITGPSKKERHRDTLQSGDPAPNFTLADPLRKRQVTLSDLRGKKPVVLIFGSYT
jgi:hypothetical protein